ncbi:SET domain-containing protein-lysine N-methyltransferase [Hirschia litorea]|uniref:SET domain-containing protein-lysine N-methyltransferase n=1 Tax=Hirschia litorea TaxID=1199156 RepID=A0ABW2IQA1_9PROT
MHTIYPETFIAAHRPPHLNKNQLPSPQDIVKKTTQEFGVGIFAVRAFKRGEVIGNFIAEETDQLLQHSLQRAPNDNLHDPYFIGMLLHSCDPNVVLDMHDQKVFCVRDIAIGEPLFMDYASTEDVLFNQFACKCGAANCRHWVTGRAEFVSPEGLAYIHNMTRSNVIAIETHEDFVFAEDADDMPVYGPLLDQAVRAASE